MIKNIKFGNYDAYLDFSLIRTGMIIGTPTPKMKTVEVEGSDGEIDLSEYFGDITYNNRQLSFEFEAIKTQEEFIELFSQIQNALHGRRMKIFISDDIDFYYIGRITVNEWKADKRTGKIVIDVNADPYKYKNSETIMSRNIIGTEDINCHNLRKKVSPTIEVAAETTIVFQTYTITLSAGTYHIPEIIFTEGENVLTITSNGLVTITYQEGVL